MEPLIKANSLTQSKKIKSLICTQLESTEIYLCFDLRFKKLHFTKSSKARRDEPILLRGPLKFSTDLKECQKNIYCGSQNNVKKLIEVTKLIFRCTTQYSLNTSCKASFYWTITLLPYGRNEHRDWKQFSWSENLQYGLVNLFSINGFNQWIFPANSN